MCGVYEVRMVMSIVGSFDNEMFHGIKKEPCIMCEARPSRMETKKSISSIFFLSPRGTRVLSGFSSIRHPLSPVSKSASPFFVSPLINRTLVISNEEAITLVHPQKRVQMN